MLIHCHTSIVLNKLREANYIMTLDLKQGYWQIPIEKDSRPFSAFTVPEKGLFQFCIMPFDLTSAPASFQWLRPNLQPKSFAYLDYIIILGKAIEEHLDLVREMFKLLRGARLKLNQEKCQFVRTELKDLGHIINQEGVHIDPEKRLNG